MCVYVYCILCGSLPVGFVLEAALYQSSFVYVAGLCCVCFSCEVVEVVDPFCLLSCLLPCLALVIAIVFSPLLLETVLGSGP